MTGLEVRILRWIDDHPPGWVECGFVDDRGDEHRFHEKAPVVSSAPLHAGSPFPQPGIIACTVVRRYTAEGGRSVVSVDTDQPWGIRSVDGRTRFDVAAESLVELDR